jgi:serine/threonine protein kinase/formylglycine-generating enzyme required for sulfatase activity
VSSPPEWTPPPEFDEYRLVRPIGRGRSGQVFLAHDTLLDRPVAVKFLPMEDPAALARFLAEARAMARLQHPHVVTLYRVGQVGDRAYLVSEYVEGVSLARVRKPAPWRRVLDVGMDLARGLHALHQRGVLHRDITPGNVMVMASGEVKLVDFGLAKVMGAPATEEAPAPAQALELPAPHDSALVGTPFFMSPEAWRGEEHTPRSDLFSLGAVLYELCTGHVPFSAPSIAALSQVVQTQDVVPVGERVPDVEPRLAQALHRCLRRDPAERFDSAAGLLDALEQIAYADEPADIPEGNPYRGLRAFSSEHRAFFFGRRREARAVLERLRTEHFVLLTGDSGVGKSSLSMAGVLPLVVEGRLQDGRSWRPVRMVPGRKPLAALSAALGPVLDGEELLEHRLREEPDLLMRTLRARLGTQLGLVLFVDQLEELVTLSEPEEAEALGRALLHLTAGAPGLRLLATARSDFLTRLAGLPGLGPEVPRALHLLRPMQPEELREAVVGPAQVKGVRYESEALVESLVRAALGTQGSLPLLQFALAELWEARREEPHVITASALEALGGVAGALARHADGVLAQLMPEERPAASSVLLRLVSADGTRARRTDAELVGGDARFRAALEALVRGRLLVATEAMEGGGTAYEIAHEALLQGWGTLAGWLAEETEQRHQRERLESAAEDWERLGRVSDALWRAHQLAEVARVEASGLTARARDFITASRRNLRRVRVLRQVVAVGFLLVVVLVGAGVQLKQRMDLNAQVDALLERARNEVLQARRLSQESEALRQQAFGLFQTGKKAEAEPLWERAGGRMEEAQRVYGQAADYFEEAHLLGPSREDVRVQLGDFLFERALLAEQLRATALRDELLHRMRLYDPEGTRWRAWSAPALLTLRGEPVGARVEVSRYGKEGELEPAAGAPRLLGTLPLEAELEPGSYLLTLHAPGHSPLRYPLSVSRAEPLSVELTLPREGLLPPGFVLVPAGRFLFGSGADTSVREFFNAIPLHPVTTGAYLIGQTETTYGQWLEYLRALPANERARRTPRVVSASMHGSLVLEEVEGRWQLTLQPQSKPYRALEGEKLRYEKRERLAEHDWLRLPVSGISSEDARAYLAWLDRSGRLPGARLCTEHEWERAARGADARRFPHGGKLEPGDANFDRTYGKQPLAFGPDEVGSHPRSRSPFGLDDMAGNVFEWVSSSLEPGAMVARGGSFYFAATTAWVNNRELPEASLRDVNVGLRVCASWPLPGAR